MTIFYFAHYVRQTVSPLAVGAISAKLGLAWGMSIVMLFGLMSSVFVAKLGESN